MGNDTYRVWRTNVERGDKVLAGALDDAFEAIDARLVALEAAQPEKPKPLEPGWYLVRWVNGNSYGVGQLNSFGTWANASGFPQATPIVVDQPIKRPDIPEPKE